MPCLQFSLQFPAGAIGRPVKRAFRVYRPSVIAPERRPRSRSVTCGPYRISVGRRHARHGDPAPMSFVVAYLDNCGTLLLWAILEAVCDAASLLQAFMKLAIAVGISDALGLKIVGEIEKTARRTARASTWSLRGLDS